MDTIFSLNDDDNFDTNLKLDLDELYESKKNKDLKTLSTYNKILKKIHQRIRNTSKYKKEYFCWYVIPEFIIGVPDFNNGDCIAYVIDKLKNNGLSVLYTHPNLLYISWNNWVPTYVRTEIKKQTGIDVDGYGNEIKRKQERNLDNQMFNFRGKKNEIVQKKKTEFRDISTYKPSGNLVYDKEFLQTLRDKLK